eukprot:260028_1
MISKSACVEHLVLLFILILCSTSSHLMSFGVSMQNTTTANTHVYGSPIGLHLNYGSSSFHCNSSYNNNQYLCVVNDSSTIECNHTHYVASAGWHSIMIYNMDISTSFLIRQIILNMNGNNYHNHINDSNYSIPFIAICVANCSNLGTKTQLFSSMDGIAIFFFDNLTLWTHVYPYGSPQIVNADSNYITNPCYSIKVLSFGFRVAPNMVHNGDVLLTLHWFDQIVWCAIPKPDPERYISTETDFICNQSNIIVNTTNAVYLEYKMQLYYDNSAAFGPSSVFITDLFGNRFDIRFCGATQLSNDNNSKEECPMATTATNAYGAGTYLYHNLNISNSRHIRLVNVMLDPRILDHANQYSIGLISLSLSTPTPIPQPTEEGIDYYYQSIIVVSFFVIASLCFTLFGCSCYVQILRKRLNEHVQQQTTLTTSNKKHQPSKEDDGDPLDSNAWEDPLDTITDLLRPVRFDVSSNKNQSITTSLTLRQPGAAKNTSTQSHAIPYSISTLTDSSQNIEGYQKPTKVDSAVHLVIIEDQDKDSDAEWDLNEEKTLLNEMLDDVMKMNGVEYMSIPQTDSSDDMHDTTLYTHRVAIPTPNEQDISIFVDQEENVSDSDESNDMYHTMGMLRAYEPDQAVLDKVLQFALRWEDDDEVTGPKVNVYALQH